MHFVARFRLRPPLIPGKGSLVDPKDAIPTRSSLLDRVRNPADDEAWEDFRRTYEGLIRRLAMKAGLSDDESKDVAQEVMVGVHRNIGEFKYDRFRCSFKSWLSNMVRWRIADRVHRRLPATATPVAFDHAEGDGDGSSEVDRIAIPAELDAVWDAEWQGARIELARQRLKRLIDEKPYQIFFLHVLRGIPAADVAKRLNVSRAQVYLVKFRVAGRFQKILLDLDSSSI